ncbi:hypothetical protein K9M47_00170 [Candidatus Gracilibacteria bacterium]|nr:hypothetical protein [Candidatus Gracilibacteria bacterium]MCF7898392.1 hypothetical protein [Candidatus Paceibacterota bacterium]
MEKGQKQGPDSSAEDIALSRAQKELGRIFNIPKASASDSSASEPVKPKSTPTENNLPKSSPTTDDGKGGGGNGNSGKGGGGSGGGNGDGFFSHEKWKNPRFVVSAIVSIIGVISLFVIAVRTNHEKKEDSSQAYSQQKISEATHASPPGWTPAPVVTSGHVDQMSQQVNSPVKKPRTVIYAKMYDCSTDEKRIDFYSQKIFQYLEGDSQSMHVGSGCVLTKVSGNITKLNGQKYRLSVLDNDPQKPNHFYNCGDMGGSHDQTSDCLSFVNQHSGREMRISVLNGGFVNLN